MKNIMAIILGIMLVGCASTNSPRVGPSIIYTPNYNIELNKDIRIDVAMDFLRSYDTRIKMKHFGTVRARNYIDTLDELSKIGQDRGVLSRLFEPGARIQFRFNQNSNVYKAYLSFWNEEIFSFQINH